MSYQFTLDGTIVEDPEGWEGLTESIKRDKILKIWFSTIETNLTFFGAGYRYLNGLRTSTGFCNRVELKINYKCSPNDPYQEIYSGFIFLSEAKFFPKTKTVECEITDDSWEARISNNKKLQPVLNVGLSKNGTVITPAPQEIMIPFKCTDGSPTTLGSSRGIDLYEAFKFIIAYMTDNEVGFESDFLNTLSPRFILINGNELRTRVHTRYPEVSFEQLFQNIDKKYNIGMLIKHDSAGRPIIKIEQASTIYDLNSALTINNVEPEISFATDSLYGNILVGSEASPYNATIHSMPPVRAFTFKEENYSIQNVCNIDNTLDLKNDFIIDSNTIEELVQTNTSNLGYEDDVFMIAYDRASGAAIQGEYIFGTGQFPVLYNEPLINITVAERWGVQGNVVKFLGNGNDEFRASKSVNDTPLSANSTITAYQFDDDTTPPNFDPNNNYSPIAFRFTSPIDGVYRFFTRISINLIATPGGIFSAILVTIRAIRKDSGGAILNTIPSTASIFNTVGIHNVDFSFTDFAFVTNYIEIEVEVEVSLGGATYQHLAGSYFECIYSQNGGGVIAENSSSNYKAARIKFNNPITHSEWATLKENKNNTLTLNGNELDGSIVWMDNVQRNLTTGEMQWDTLTDLANLNI